MQIQIRLFGAFRKYYSEPIQLELVEKKSIAEIKKLLGQELNRLNPQFSDFELLEKSALADSKRVLDSKETVDVCSTLAILPPVCGG